MLLPIVVGNTAVQGRMPNSVCGLSLGCSCALPETLPIVVGNTAVQSEIPNSVGGLSF
eukprot:CCRYP_008355-RA/>CCRYP_008355-RA protein AED:0.00 eAED:0.00 QI:65/1/0.5/1/0/0/2/0/57